jgi:hypothetical protein
MGLPATVTIGTLHLSLQAAITVVAGVIIGLATIIVFPSRWLLGFALTAAFFLAAYNVNCVVVGKCKTWAWILTAFYLAYIALAIPAMFLKVNVYKVAPPA